MNSIKTKHKKNAESGFTLVEVLASLVIISIIFIGAFNLIISTNEVAVSNNNRLVAINLGKATIERVKNNPSIYFNQPEANDIDYDYGVSDCASINESETDIDNCQNLYDVTINDNEYSITLRVNQDSDEEKLNLIDLLVTVELPGENIKHQVEGYVKNANE